MRDVFHMPVSPPHILQLTECTLEGRQVLLIKLLSSLSRFQLGFIEDLIALRNPLFILIRNKGLSGNTYVTLASMTVLRLDFL